MRTFPRQCCVYGYVYIWVFVCINRILSHISDLHVFDSDEQLFSKQNSDMSSVVKRNQRHTIYCEEVKAKL